MYLSASPTVELITKVGNCEPEHLGTISLEQSVWYLLRAIVVIDWQSQQVN